MLYYTILYYIILYDSLAPRQRSAGTRWSTAPSTRQAATASGSLEAEAVRACLRSEATRRDVPRSGFRFSAYLFLSPSFSLYIYLSLSIYIYIYTHMFACFPPQVWLTGGASCPASSCLGEPLHPQPVGELRRSTACRTETTETLATQPLEPRGGGDTLVWLGLPQRCTLKRSLETDSIRRRIPAWRPFKESRSVSPAARTSERAPLRRAGALTYQYD